jgi:hypothetical protein
MAILYSSKDFAQELADMDKATRLAEKNIRERRMYGKKMQQQHHEQKRKRQLENQMEQEAARLHKKHMQEQREIRKQIAPKVCISLFLNVFTIICSNF